MLKQELLIELGTEELPARLVRKISDAFANSLSFSLTQSGFSFASINSFATPRRIAVVIEQLDACQAPQTISRKGPNKQVAFDQHGSPTPAALGFARSCNVNVEQLAEKVLGKDTFLFFEQEQPGQTIEQLLQQFFDSAIKQLPLPKKMRWGANPTSFIRPVHWIIALYGKQVVPLKFAGITSSNHSFGHRFLSNNQSITINQPSEYVTKLKDLNVIVDLVERKQLLIQELQSAADKQHGKIILDEDLLEENLNLVEFPVVLSGKFKASYLKVPKECLISSMQDHQKCFAMQDQHGQLLPTFLLTSNLKSTEPQTVINGNEKVINARLADAEFHYLQDLKKTIKQHNKPLANMVFQQQLGTLEEKVARIVKIAEQLAAKLDANRTTVIQAAELCKADLNTNMVYEFPELQGIMGKYYALHSKLSQDVAIAIEQHYLPRFAEDMLPSSKAAAAISIADRMDTLVGLFAIGKIPTGEKDPFALRRHALAILRICIELKINLDLDEVIEIVQSQYPTSISDSLPKSKLQDFIFDRIKHLLSAQGFNKKAIDAVRASASLNPYDIALRIDALQNFQQQQHCSELSEANKRVKNILDKQQQLSTKIEEALFQEEEERQLFAEITSKQQETTPLLKEAEYSKTLETLASLQQPVDKYFAKVMVNSKDPQIKNNRLAVLAKLRELFVQVADISML